MLTILLALIAQVTPATPQVSSRDVVLKDCIQVFGRRVDDSPILFDVNPFYVLRVQFGKDDQLEQAAIEPKFYYADTHPAWEEPDNFEWLSKEQVSLMLAKLDRLRSIGNLVQRYSGIVITTNMTNPITDQYQHAAVTRGEVYDLRDPVDAPSLVRYVRVRYKEAQ